MTLAAQYLWWIGRLGWTTRPMLTTLTRSLAPSHDKNVDKNLDKCLNRWQREGMVRRLRMGRRSVYYLPKYNTGRSPNVRHGVMSAQAVVFLWRQFPARERMILTPSDFAKAGLTVIPDFGLIVRFSNGIHLFALEYQTAVEAGRSTVAKLKSYASSIETMKSRFNATAIWVIVLVERERLWVEQFAREIEWSFAYMIDTHDFFVHPACATQPIFFAPRAVQTPLVDT